MGFFALAVYAQMPKASYFLGHWKIGKLWKMCYSLKVAKLQDTQLQVSDPHLSLPICVMLLTDHIYACTGTANQHLC